MNCPICGKEVPLDLTQKVIWTFGARKFVVQIIQKSKSKTTLMVMVSVLIFAPKLRMSKAELVKE